MIDFTKTNRTPPTSINEVRKKREWSRHPVGDHNDPLPKTAEKIAAEQHVSAPTVKRDAEYAKAVDAIGESLGQDVKQRIRALLLTIAAYLLCYVSWNWSCWLLASGTWDLCGEGCIIMIYP